MGPLSFKDMKNESTLNGNAISNHHSSHHNENISSLRPPNFEQLMLLHHAQQQRRLQQNSSNLEDFRLVFIHKLTISFLFFLLLDFYDIDKSFNIF